ncbi:hypothetical protein [Georgenia yuyongxinii]|nr:hypothetical protein [Georgenia yuyongxinii]
MHVIKRSKPDGIRLDQFEGREFGSGVSINFVSTDRLGAGPYLHEHP